MRDFLPEPLISLARELKKQTGKPLYLVGGCVRDFLAGFPLASSDFDLCAPVPADIFKEIAVGCGFHADATYARTGTVKISKVAAENKDAAKKDIENKLHPSSVCSTDSFPPGGSLNMAENCFAGRRLDKVEAEYAAFRSDKYVRGEHTPAETFFTEDISLDARRRDFACNAIYYDISANSFVDPLGGMSDVSAKILRTADLPDKVFGEDGLRLLRLARFAGTTGFTPTAETIASAKKNAALIADIAPERVFAELKLILTADEKYGNERGVYEALKILDITRVLDGIFPELTAGRNLKQRADFHDHDVLEHSLRAAAYSVRAGGLSGGEDVPAPFDVRLAALLHDIGKPAAYFRDGKFSDHPNVGAEICRAALTRLKAPAKTIALTENLTRWHMYDYDLKTKENKLRKFIVAHYDIFGALLLVKQADYSACKDDLSPAPCVIRLKNLEAKMRAENVPFTLKELAVRGNEIAPLLPAPRYVGATLNKLLLHCAITPSDNSKERLLRLAPALAECK